MSNASLKEQLQAVASELSDTLGVKLKQSPTATPNTSIKKKFTPQPAPKLQKPKPKWLDYAHYGLELLKVYFPQSFKSLKEIKPLKKGIKQDLVKRLSELSNIVTDDKACMVKSLAFYVNTAAYHKSVIEGAARIDLDGQEAGVVSAEEATYSLERYKIKVDTKNNKNNPK